MNFLKTTLANPYGLKKELQGQSKTLANGTCLEFLDSGVLRVKPISNHDQKVIISSGIHGNETAPIEIVECLVNEISSGQLVPENDLLFIIGNPAAVNAESRFVEENLNRLFSGKHQHSVTQEADRAAKLELLVGDFFKPSDQCANPLRLHYDLHTAIRKSELEKFAVYPFLKARDRSNSQIAFLEQCGVEAVLFSNQPSGTFSYFSSNEFGADAFTIELGRVRKFGDNNMVNFDAITDGLRQLILGRERFDRAPKSIKLFSVVEEVIKRTDAFKLHIKNDAKNFTEFKSGTLLASDKGYEYRTQEDGERFVFPISNVPCGQRAMLVVAPTKLL